MGKAPFGVHNKKQHYIIYVTFSMNEVERAMRTSFTSDHTSSPLILDSFKKALICSSTVLSAKGAQGNSCFITS